MHDQPRYVLVSSPTPEDATTTLFFGNLGQTAAIRIVSSGFGPRSGAKDAKLAHDVSGALAGASAVIVVRNLLDLDTVRMSAAWLGVPRYYFTDDNFVVVRESGVGDARWFRRYSLDRVRRALRHFEGVLLATASLVEYFERERLHDRTILYPPIAGPAIDARPRTHAGVTVGFFGGLHRRESFLSIVYPALRRLAAEHDVRLVTAGVDRAQLAIGPRLPVVSLAYNRSYEDALGEMASQGIDVLVHPGRGGPNDIYKNTHMIINAHALGAVPVCSRVPPYDSIEGEGVALLCENTEQSWYEALARLAVDAALRQAMGARAAAYCSSYYSGDRNRQAVSAILEAHPSPTANARAARLLLGTAVRGVSLGQHLAARLFARRA